MTQTRDRPSVSIYIYRRRLRVRIRINDNSVLEVDTKTIDLGRNLFVHKTATISYYIRYAYEKKK